MKNRYMASLALMALDWGPRTFVRPLRQRGPTGPLVTLAGDGEELDLGVGRCTVRTG